MSKSRESSSPKVRKPRIPKAATNGHANGGHPTQEQIALRAYQIYLARNGAPGDAFEDWTRAERELVEESQGAQTARKPRKTKAPEVPAA
jgi:Protein of unknown function (DUF2934)